MLHAMEFYLAHKSFKDVLMKSIYDEEKSQAASPSLMYVKELQHKQTHSAISAQVTGWTSCLFYHLIEWKKFVQVVKG